MTNRDDVQRYYDSDVGFEYTRLMHSPLHECEYQLTIDLLDEYIPPGATVLDVGSGPGRYAEYLLRERKCKVGLIDISQASLDAFCERVSARFRRNVLLVRKAWATDLAWLADGAFDSVLLMGPLYHLTAEDERRLAVREGLRVAKPGGTVFAAFISPYQKLCRLLHSAPPRLANDAYVGELIKGGVATTSHLEREVQWHLCWPSDARALMESEGLKTVRLRNLEGLTTLLPDDEIETLRDPARKLRWFDVLRQTCENPDALGATIHYLYVGRKAE